MSSVSALDLPIPTASQEDYGKVLLQFVVKGFLENNSLKRKQKDEDPNRGRPGPYQGRSRRVEWPIVHNGAAKHRPTFANIIGGQFLLITDELEPIRSNPYIQSGVATFSQPMLMYDSLLYKEHKEGMHSLGRVWIPSFTLYNNLIVYADHNTAPPTSRDVWVEPGTQAEEEGGEQMEIEIATGTAALLSPNSLSNAIISQSPTQHDHFSPPAPAHPVPAVVQAPAATSASDNASRSTRSAASKATAVKN